MKKFLSLIILVLLVFSFAGCDDSNTNDDLLDSSYDTADYTDTETLENTKELVDIAEVPDTWTNLQNKNYKDVKKLFEDAGFTNIICTEQTSDYNNSNGFEGSVANILIGENGEITTFEKGEQLKKDVKIQIYYLVKPAETETTAIKSTEAPVQTQPSGASSTEYHSVGVPNYEETKGNLVWVPTNGGTKYHSKSSCSGMKDPIEVSKDTAISNGFTPCSRCY